MNLQIPNQLLQQKQYGLQVSQLFFQKSHLFFDFCFRHSLPEQPCVPTCPAPIPGARAPWGDRETHVAIRQPHGESPGSAPQDMVAQPLFLPTEELQGCQHATSAQAQRRRTHI